MASWCVVSRAGARSQLWQGLARAKAAGAVRVLSSNSTKRLVTSMIEYLLGEGVRLNENVQEFRTIV